MSFLMPNVTGQRTRHLVAGTLDPIVGLIYNSYYKDPKCRAPIVINPIISRSRRRACAISHVLRPLRAHTKSGESSSAVKQRVTMGAVRYMLSGVGENRQPYTTSGQTM